MTYDQLVQVLSALGLQDYVPLLTAVLAVISAASHLAPQVTPPTPTTGALWRVSYVLLNLVAGNYKNATNATDPRMTGAAVPPDQQHPG